ncbi:hypothetical protein N9Y33_03375 [Bacteroidia bacterium]|jgi:hypothetical protein|nr:hypothetical protein [Bacteroidia bacterium]
MSKVPNISRIITPLAIVFSILFVQCVSGPTISEKRVVMLQSVDSLWNGVKEIRSRFTFRMDEFQERRTYMEKQRIKAQFLPGDQLSKEDVMTFDKYNNVYRLYKAIGKKYRTAVLQAEDIFYATKGIEKQVKNGFYDEKVDAFKKEYQILRQKTDSCKTLTFDVTDRLRGVEPLYLRTSKRVGEIFEELLPEQE